MMGALVVKGLTLELKLHNNPWICPPDSREYKSREHKFSRSYEGESVDDFSLYR